MKECRPGFGLEPTGSLAGTELRGMEFDALGRAQGGEARKVNRARDLEAIMSTALRARGPTLVEVDVA